MNNDAIGECPKCERAVYPSQKESWCLGCYEPLPDEIKTKLSTNSPTSSIATPQAAKSNEFANQPKPYKKIGLLDEPVEYDKSVAVGLLEVIAWLNLVGGIITAIYIWFSMGKVRSETNPIAIVFIIAALAEAIIGCVFLLVVVEIAVDTRIIKKLLKKSQKTAL